MDYASTEEALCTIPTYLKPSFAKSDIQKSICKDTTDCSATLLAYWDGYNKYTKSATQACKITKKNFNLNSIKHLGLGNAVKLFGKSGKDLESLLKIREQVQKDAKEKIEQNLVNIRKYSKDSPSNISVSQKFEHEIRETLKGELKPNEAKQKSNKMINSKEMSTISGTNKDKLQRNIVAAIYGSEFINNLQYDLSENKNASKKLNDMTNTMNASLPDDDVKDATYTPPTPIMGDSGLTPALSGAAMFALQKLGLGDSSNSDISGTETISKTPEEPNSQFAKGNDLKQNSNQKNEVHFQIEESTNIDKTTEKEKIKESGITNRERAPTLDAIDQMAAVMKEIDSDGEIKINNEIENNTFLAANNVSKSNSEENHKQNPSFNIDSQFDPFSTAFNGSIRSDDPFATDSRTPAQDENEEFIEPDWESSEYSSIPKNDNEQAQAFYDAYTREHLENPQFLEMQSNMVNSQSVDEALKDINIFARIHECYRRTTRRQSL
ncbi:MAG: hypothetical protein M9962_07650 [Oligoflexia bacterium]|nr:hypothetical protein [Oligoflexia bacterium]